MGNESRGPSFHLPEFRFDQILGKWRIAKFCARLCPSVRSHLTKSISPCASTLCAYRFGREADEKPSERHNRIRRLSRGVADEDAKVMGSGLNDWQRGGHRRGQGFGGRS